MQFSGRKGTRIVQTHRCCCGLPRLLLLATAPFSSCTSLLQMLYNDIILYQSKQRTTEGAKKPRTATEAVDGALFSGGKTTISDSTLAGKNAAVKFASHCPLL